MAFNWQTFRTRTLSSILFAAVMLAGLLWNKWSFFILISVIHFGCWFEYLRLLGLIDPGYKKITAIHKFGLMLAGWCIMLYFTGDNYTVSGFRLNELPWWTGVGLFFLSILLEILITRKIRLKNIGFSLFGLIYISLSLGLLMDIAGLTKNPGTGEVLFANYNMYLPALIILSLWINDTMAYLVGSLIGRTSLSRISPKKTWEGTIGGIVISSGLAFLIPYFFDIPQIDPGTACLVASVSAVVGTVGDLFESKLKRMAGVKDTGQLMPGHGGFLDRFDSLLFAIPAAWILLQPCVIHC